MKLWFAMFCLSCLLLGCVTDKKSSPSKGGMVRPDGSLLPDPFYATNVYPWVYTNKVSYE